MGRLILRNLRLGAKAHLFNGVSRLCFIEGEEGDGTLTPDAGAGGEAASLHDVLNAAYDAAETSQTAPPVAAAAPVQQAAPPAGDAPKTPAQLAAEQAARDAAGRFAKPAEAVQVKPVAPTAPGAPGEPAAQQAQIIAPPPSWSALAKAKFAALDPIIQQEVLKRERDIETGKAEWEGKAQKFNALDEILAPRRDQLAVAGLDDVGAVRALFAAQDMLQRTPVDALLYLGRTVNVNWNMLVQRLTGNHVAPQQPGQPQGQPQQPQPAAAPDPRLMQHIQHLTNTVNQQQQERQQATRQQVDQEIGAFASDPANLYFANVKGAMAQIIQASARAGQQISLKDAYERATWADPTIRPLLITAQGSVQQQAATQAQRDAAARARQASGSLAGSPTPGARQATPKRDIRDELGANWDAAATG